MRNVAKRQTLVSFPGGEGYMWASENFVVEPRRRSWPYEPTNLERLAEAAGIDGNEYRLLLAEAIQARRRVRGAAWERLDNRFEKRAGCD